MSSYSFLAYLPDIFGVFGSKFCLLSENGEFRHIPTEAISDLEGPIITYEISILIDSLRISKTPPPKNLVCIEDAIYMNAGITRSEGGEKKKNAWLVLLKGFEELNDADTFKEVFESRKSRPNDQDIRRLLESAALALKKAWSIIYKSLSVNEEIERFLNIEVPIRNLFNTRQFLGLDIDKNISLELIELITDEKYKAFQLVANAISRSPSGLNFWNIQPYLERTDASHLEDVKDGGNLREEFKLASHSSSFAKNFLNYINAASDEAIIQRALGPNDRLFPIYDVLGTVTSRILVTDPNLQQLRKKYRSIVAPDEGKKLIYLDYCQFEPGIFSYLSKDENLRKSYNQGDIYISLSLEIYGDSESRPLAKKIFLAYSYGMSPDRIALLLTPPNSNKEELDNLSNKITKFFSQYPSLENYRRQQFQALEEQGFVNSLFGNKRYRLKNGKLSYRESRWAINHPIQASASLIFKEAIIGLAQSFGNESILLPVHDAVLMQFDDDAEFGAKVEKAKEIMNGSFERRCPGITSRVEASKF